LHGVGAGRDLAVQIARGRGREDLHQVVPRLGLLVHEALDVEVVARGTALDEVRRDRERRAREADERRSAASARFTRPTVSKTNGTAASTSIDARR